MTEYIDVMSPIDQSRLGSVPIASVKDVNNAVAKAKTCFKQTARKLSPYKRYEILTKICEAFEARRDEIAEMITRESGKIIRDSQGEILRAVSLTRYAAEEAKRIHGEIFPCDILDTHTGKTAYVERHPIGVIAAITPFNFPINTVMHKLAPAIAGGNCCVLKPSPKTPLTAEILRDIFSSVGLPDGMVEIIHGNKETGEALVTHPDVRMVSFTGGVPIGEHIAKLTGLKKITMELGGNGALVVMPDANLNDAAQTAIDQGLGTCGQRCTAVKRLFVHKAVKADFTKILVGKVKALVIGNPLDPKTDIGPMINETAAIHIEALVKDAINDGAKLLWSGDRDGAILPPIIVDDTPFETMLVKEETFGPVLPLIEFEDIENCVEMINSTDYGLQAGIFTNTINVAKHFRNELDVGAVIVNGGPGFRVDSLPFGGVKKSGIGREGIKAAIAEMTEEKVFVL